jgi:hypothetical protein
MTLGPKTYFTMQAVLKVLSQFPNLWLWRCSLGF